MPGAALEVAFEGKEAFERVDRGEPGLGHGRRDDAADIRSFVAELKAAQERD